VVAVAGAAVAGAEVVVAEGAAVAAAAAVAAVAAAAAAVAAAGGDREEHTMRNQLSRPILCRATIVALVALAPALASAAESAAQKKFPNPPAAMKSLVAALRANNQTDLLAILGPGSEDIISSGDPIADRAAGQRFAARATEHTRLETLDSGAVIAHVGKEDWPLPIPLVKDADEWRFDAPAGRDELLNRRIGRNELKALDVCRVYVEAQREYAAREGSKGSPIYAQKLRSDPGKHDGLYWDDPTGKHPSPLGPLLAEADAEGYTKQEPGAAPRPYHGYIYRSLTAQGAKAPGGARSYLKDGKMTGGFALLAYPAEHGSSGVMTFIVGPEGVVFQKNLGDKTDEVAKGIAAFDPDDSWTPVRD
jgi:hypothetical protein